MSPAPFRNPLVLALDVDDREQALRIADQVGDLVGGIKLGPRLCLREGAAFCQEMAKRAPLFMDNKHFDIPSTMEAAIHASFAAGASVVTVHALSGLEALTRMAALEAELRRQRPFRILAVTILTSWDENSLSASLIRQPIGDHVRVLADLVQKSGLSSVVCSPHEIDLLKHKNLFLLTPGIRFGDDATQDQKRTAGPAEALRAGASALVVGRPIVQARDPREATLKFLAACEADSQ